jgi:calcium-binding protein CML
VSFQQIEQMIADVDRDGSGAIDYDEFEHMMTAKIGERDTKEELMKAFHIIDQDKNVNIRYLLYYTSLVLLLIDSHCIFVVTVL